MDKQERLIERIRKLLALAGNNPSEEEAHAALAHAQTLAAREGLALEDIEAAAPPEPGEAELHRGTRAPPWWHRDIAAIVARNFRCQAISRRLRHNWTATVLVGMPQDLEVATYVWSTARRMAGQQARAYIASRSEEAQAGGLFWSSKLSRRLRNDYLAGWVSGLEQAFRRNVEAEDLAPMLIRDPAIDQLLEQRGTGKARPPSVTRAGSAQAFRRGQEEGRAFQAAERVEGPGASGLEEEAACPTS